MEELPILLPILVSPKEKVKCHLKGCRNKAYVWDYFGTDYNSDGTTVTIYVPLCFRHYRESLQLEKVKDFWKQPIIDPITGDRAALSEKNITHVSGEPLLKLGTKPKQGSSAEEKPKDNARVASELSAQTSSENTLKSEVLPKSLRVPPDVDEYMKSVAFSEEHMIQCLICEKAGKSFYTSNVDDMTLHVQRGHGKLSFQPEPRKAVVL